MMMWTATWQGLMDGFLMKVVNCMGYTSTIESAVYLCPFSLPMY
jgi:hypothetical protein